MMRSIHVLARLAALLAVALTRAQVPTSAPTSAPAPTPSYEDEFRAALLAQPAGRFSIAQYHLPDEFVRRVADRKLRVAYEQQFRIVIAGLPATRPTSTSRSTSASQPASSSASASSLGNVRTLPIAMSDEQLEYWCSLSEGRPAIRAFRANLSDDPATRWPLLPAPPEQIVECAVGDYVAQSLAKLGLLTTLAGAIDASGIDRFLAASGPELDFLRQVGVPVDLLEHFIAPGGDAPMSAEQVVRRIAEDLKQNYRATREKNFADWRFQFRPSASRGAASGGDADMRLMLAPDSGERKLVGLRAQLTRGDDWLAPGDGGSLDLLRHVLQRVQPGELSIHIETRHVAGLLAQLASRPMPARLQCTIVPSPLPVAQWAQDNARTAFELDAAGAIARRVSVVPRFASRGEEAAIFVPGETLIQRDMRQSGQTVIQSPLHFQGGNLIVVGDVGAPGRTLLVGEAEMWRNTSLGLREAHVLDAFKVEFGVARVVVLPAASYHIDYEVSVRTLADRTVALVSDPVAAARIVISIGLGTFMKHGVITDAELAAARDLLQKQRDVDLLNFAGPMTARLATNFGQYPQRVADWFSVGPADSGVGNFQRYLLALDLLAAASIVPDEVPEIEDTIYVRALQRQMADRAELVKRVEALGWTIVKIPSIASGERSINYLNGIHDRGRFLMPTVGGLYTPLDEAAMRAVRAALGREVQIVPLHCSESQRRDGAVRCSFQPLYE
ncbi:MAG: hypothetical protein ACKVS9_01770 [Phycisphaerae bacterium]